jgi:RNA polymerase sigma-70 factor (ECF subfamily)
LISDEARDDDLMAAVAQGDRRAFQVLMRRHAPTLIALAQRVTGSEADADEVVQESFLKVWTLAGRWRADGPARLPTWLHRVVLNAAIDRRRRVVPAPLDEAGDPVDEAPGGLEAVMSRQCHRAVVDSLGDLPERQRTALSLFYFGDLTAPQAATQLGLTLPAVESLLVRGKRALRHALTVRGITRLGDVL